VFAVLVLLISGHVHRIMAEETQLHHGLALNKRGGTASYLKNLIHPNVLIIRTLRLQNFTMSCIILINLQLVKLVVFCYRSRIKLNI